MSETVTANAASTAAETPGPDVPAKKPLWRKIRRRLTGFVLFILVLLTLLLCAVFWLGGTDSGFSRASQLLNQHIDGLSLEEVSGNLREGIQAKRARFNNDTIDITALNVDSSWHLRCLLEREFCLDRLIIDELSVRTFATETPPPSDLRQDIVLPDIELPLGIVINEARINALRFQPPGDAPEQRVEAIHLALQASGRQVVLQDASLRYQTTEAQLSGDITTQGDWPLNLILSTDTNDLLPDSIAGGTGLQPVQTQTQLSGSVAQLTVALDVSGSAELTLNGEVQPLSAHLPLNMTVESTQIGWPLERFDQVGARDTQITLNGDLEDYQVTLKTALSGQQLPDTSINLQGLVNTQRVSLPNIVINTLGGTARGAAEASITEPLNWQTDWQLADIDPAVQFEGLNGNLNAQIRANGAVNQGQWSLNLEQGIITGVLRQLPFNLQAKVNKSLSNIWTIEQVTLNNDQNQLRAQGQVTDQWDISADVRLPQLQNVVPTLNGGFDAKLAISGALQTPNVILDAQADSLQWQDIRIEGLSVSGDIRQLFENTSRLTAQLNTLRSGDTVVSNSQLSLEGQRSQHTLTFSTNGPEQTRAALSLQGSLSESLNWQGTLQTLTAEVPEHDIVLLEPVPLRWQNQPQQLSIAPHCWGITDARLCLQTPIRNAFSDSATLSLDNYILSQLNPMMPSDTRIDGVLSTTAVAQWGNPTPQLNLKAIIDQISVATTDATGETLRFAYNTLRLDTVAAPDDLQATLALDSDNLGNATVEIQLNPLEPESTIDGTLNLQGLNLNVARAFLPDFDAIEGNVNARGRILGTLTQPIFNGNITLSEPQLRSELLPLPVTGGELMFSIAGDNLVIDGELESDEGRVAIDGGGRLNPQNWRVEAELTGRNLNISSDPLQQSSVSHTINIRANPRAIVVNGDITIPEAVIDVGDLPQGAATLSDDIIIIEELEEETRAEAVAASGLNLSVALDISLGDNVTLSAYGLDARLTGDFDLRLRTPDPPQLGGEIRVVDGIYKQYGQNLEANGQILFVGPIDSTRLDIDAVRTIDEEDRIAGLRIGGSVNTPELSLFTEPADKSEDAVLSYIILGRDINEASDQEANLLATAALALAVRGGRNVAGSIADALGVKEFALETRGRGDDTELVVSGRLNDRLLLRYGRGVFDDEYTLYLRYDLTRKLYLEAAQGVEDAIDLFYTFSF